MSFAVPLGKVLAALRPLGAIAERPLEPQCGWLLSKWVAKAEEARTLYQKRWYSKLKAYGLKDERGDWTVPPDQKDDYHSWEERMLALPVHFHGTPLPLAELLESGKITTPPKDDKPATTIEGPVPAKVTPLLLAAAAPWFVWPADDAAPVELPDEC